MSILVDANVLSETVRASPAPEVLDWLRKHEPELVVDSIVFGELLFGIKQLPKGRRRTKLQTWFDESIRTIPCLDFTQATAERWAELLARLRATGQAMPIKDSLIAASALANELALATRNVRDFEKAGVRVINPFTPH